ncbi:hypothetical protein BLA29_010179 [Euroglyphus maynei]|uniref:Uncharacterized protein n=1 Tax=Euroglyphus maynei TaxID=6958 RepID=A0A1Y3AR17_EURMA|nr:hypothetical protein BLA29_010179 [Euroglyphus maynei]
MGCWLYSCCRCCINSSSIHRKWQYNWNKRRCHCCCGKICRHHQWM